jgi:tetratricopeptide (TPR) repeat protein
MEWLFIFGAILFVAYDIRKLRKARRRPRQKPRKISARAASETKPPVRTLDQAALQRAQNLARQLTESLDIVERSSDAGTKVSRLALARARYADLQALVKANPAIEFRNAERFDSLIRMHELRELQYGYKVAAEGNQRGIELEREGAIDLAIAQYESLVSLKVETPHTYRRLAILYRKQKQVDEEIRALRAALDNVPKENADHYGWFLNRLAKVEAARTT